MSWLGRRAAKLTVWTLRLMTVAAVLLAVIAVVRLRGTPPPPGPPNAARIGPVQEEELEVRAPPTEPVKPETPGIEVPPGDPFLRGLFPESPAGYATVAVVVICAVLIFRKFLRRARPKDIG